MSVRKYYPSDVSDPVWAYVASSRASVNTAREASAGYAPAASRAKGPDLVLTPPPAAKDEAVGQSRLIYGVASAEAPARKPAPVSPSEGTPVPLTPQEAARLAPGAPIIALDKPAQSSSLPMRNQPTRW